MVKTPSPTAAPTPLPTALPTEPPTKQPTSSEPKAVTKGASGELGVTGENLTCYWGDETIMSTLVGCVPGERNDNFHSVLKKS